MSVFVSLFAIFITFFLYLVYLTKNIYKTWKKRGVPYEEPVLFLGNTWKCLFKSVTQGERMKGICDLYPNEPVVGYFEYTRPMLLVKDADYVEKILIKDFAHFVDHGFEADESVNPLDVSIFNMTGKSWRALRNKLSPIFTTGKLKKMFQQLSIIGENMENVVMNGKMNCVDLMDIYGRFSMDVIGSFAFGIDAGNLLNPDSEFTKMALKTFEVDLAQLFKFFVLSCFPNLSKRFGISFNRRDVQDYFVKIIKNTIEYRKMNKGERNDFLDLMLELKYKGHVEITKDLYDEYLDIDQTTDSYELTDDLILGQAFIFLTAGFETSATIMTNTCYELAKNPAIQKKVRDEILSKTKDKNLNYESLKEMTYLDMCIKETMRKYTPSQTLFRVCTKEYTFPNGVNVKPGEVVLVPITYMHLNPDNYPEPNKFDPERFGPDRKIRPGTYLPFGEGPRICIAMRFATLQIKYGLAKILMEFRLKLNPKTQEPLVFNHNKFVTTSKYPIYFDLSKV